MSENIKKGEGSGIFGEKMELIFNGLNLVEKNVVKFSSAVEFWWKKKNVDEFWRKNNSTVELRYSANKGTEKFLYKIKVSIISRLNLKVFLLKGSNIFRTKSRFDCTREISTKINKTNQILKFLIRGILVEI
jgi:hypothetical protein